MKNIRLRTAIQGVRGGKSKYHEAGYTHTTIQQKGNSMCDISVDAFEGYGEDYKERPEAFITISFHDGVTKPFSGTAEELKKKLTA